MTFDLREQTLLVSGKVGTVWVYQKNGRRRVYVIPTNPQTEDQQAWRGLFGDTQKELVFMGETVRAKLSNSLGYTWHALAIGFVLANAGARWDFYSAEFLLFSSGDQAAWASFDGLPGLVNLAGMVFYIVSSSVHEMLLERDGFEPFEEPSATNSAEIAEEWEREMPSGFYVPTISNLVNLSSASISGSVYWGQTGNYVVMGGHIFMDPIAALEASVQLTLPVVTTFSAAYLASGSMTTQTHRAGYCQAVAGQARVLLDFTAQAVNNRKWRFFLGYYIE